ERAEQGGGREGGGGGGVNGKEETKPARRSVDQTSTAARGATHCPPHPRHAGGKNHGHNFSEVRADPCHRRWAPLPGTRSAPGAPLEEPPRGAQRGGSGGTEARPARRAPPLLSLAAAPPLPPPSAAMSPQWRFGRRGVFYKFRLRR
ncbi:unnamed protein product, partial [Prorocentrum cordatum]